MDEKERDSLDDMKKQSFQDSLGAKQAYINALEFHIKELEVEVDKLTLSKQDAEGQLNILRPEYCKLQERVRGLVGGIEKHKKVMEDHGLLDDSGKYFTTKADNELYKLIKK